MTSAAAPVWAWVLVRGASAACAAWAVLEAKLLPAGMRACGTGECDALPCGAPDLLQSFQQERWYGIRPVLWGSELRETELARGMYGATLNVDGADE